MARPWLRTEATASRHWEWLRIYWVNSRGQPIKSVHPAWGLGWGWQVLIVKSSLLRNVTHDLWLGRIFWNDLSKEKWTYGLAHGKRFYRAGSLTAVAREMARMSYIIVGVQEVRWNKGDTEPPDHYTLFYRNRNEKCELGAGLFIYMESYQQFIRQNLLVTGSCIQYCRGCWCDIIFWVFMPQEMIKLMTRRTNCMRD
jgi:hypothetical protein